MTFAILTLLFIIVSIGMILIILVQRPSGGGLAGAFGGAGGGGTDTVFGGKVGDALTWATVIAFGLYLVLAVTVNLVPRSGAEDAATAPAGLSQPIDPITGEAGDAPVVPPPSGVPGIPNAPDDGDAPAPAEDGSDG